MMHFTKPTETHIFISEYGKDHRGRALHKDTKYESCKNIFPTNRTKSTQGTLFFKELSDLRNAVDDTKNEHTVNYPFKTDAQLEAVVTVY